MKTPGQMQRGDIVTLVGPDGARWRMRVESACTYGRPSLASLPQEKVILWRDYGPAETEPLGVTLEVTNDD